MAFVVCSLAVAAHGQDDRAVDDVAAAVPQIQQQQENRVDLGAIFDRNVFQQTGGGFSLGQGPGGRPSPTGDDDRAAESTTLATVRGIADRHLARIDEACGPTDQQRRKLLMAMESDFRQIVEEVDAERSKYTGVEVNLSDQAGQRRWHQFQQDVQRCRNGLRGLFDPESLFAKVLPTTLDESQFAALTAEIKAQKSCRWKALVAAALTKLDDTLGLDQPQYDAIERMLLDKEPPLRIDGYSTNREVMQSQQWLVYVVLSEVDGERLKGTVSEWQWTTLSHYANQGKSMRSHLEQLGILERQSK